MKNIYDGCEVILNDFFQFSNKIKIDKKYTPKNIYDLSICENKPVLLEVK